MVNSGGHDIKNLKEAMKEKEQDIFLIHLLEQNKKSDKFHSDKP